VDGRHVQVRMRVGDGTPRAGVWYRPRAGTVNPCPGRGNLDEDQAFNRLCPPLNPRRR
jgi:hypothetical protein